MAFIDYVSNTIVNCLVILPIISSILIQENNLNSTHFSSLNVEENRTSLSKHLRFNNSRLDISYRIADEDIKTLENGSSYSLSNHRALLKNFKKTWPLQRWRDIGIFTDDYLELLNEHWLRYPPPPESVHQMLGGFYIVFVTTGLCGNVLVLFMYTRCRSLRTPGNVLVANLALSDFLMLAKTPIFIFNSFNLGPALGKPGCVVYGFIGGLSGTTSIATLAAIALDRYWAVVRPLEPLRSLTALRARFLAAAAWIYAAVFSSIPALDIGYGRYVPEGYLTSCSFDYLTDELPPRYFIFVFFCAAWLAPFSTIFFCYLKILFVVIFNRNVTLKHQEQRMSSRHIKEQVKRKAEVKLAVLVIAVIALFFLSWTPYAIVALIGIFGKKELITPIVSMVPALFCKTAACINPFIYIISHPNFRKELNKILRGRRSDSRRMTTKSSYYSEATRIRRSSSKNLALTDVEVLELKDIPYSSTGDQANEVIRTVTAKVDKRDKLQHSDNYSFKEDSIVSPSSWFVKPDFSKEGNLKKTGFNKIITVNSTQETF